MQRRIDPTSERAQFRQLADILRDLITSGEWEPGRSLPGEAYLGGEHGVSQGTVRRALAVLAAEGLVERRPGLPWRVREREEPTVVRRGSGARVSYRVATRDDHLERGIPEGTPVLVVSAPGKPDEVYRADETVIEFDSEQD